MKSQMSIAAELAVKYHEDQEYGDSGLPYIYHLHQVDQLVVAAYKPKGLKHHEPFSKHPGDEMDNLRAIAFLHDILEDTKCSVFKLIDAGLTDTVVEAILAITKKDETYEDYLRGVMNNPLALKVKIADTASNLAHSVIDQNQRRIDKYVRQLNILKGFEKL